MSSLTSAEVRLVGRQLRDFPQLGPKVEVAFLQNNFFESITPNVKDLKDLRVINLERNQIRSGHHFLSHLENLETINLSHNRLGEESYVLFHIKKLKDLRVNNNQLSMFPRIISPSLENLNAEFNRIKEIPEEVGELTELKTLLLHENDINKLPRRLFSLDKLSILNLTSNELFKLSKKFEKLVSLRVLLAANNSIGGNIEHILRLPKLEELDLSHNLISNFKFPKEPIDFFCLKRLLLSRNGIRNIPPHIGLLQETLEELRMDENGIREVPLELFELKKLKILSLSMNRIEMLPNAFTSLENLVEVNFQKNAIANFPSSLGKLTKLQTLNFNDNHIEEIPFPFCCRTILDPMEKGINPYSPLFEKGSLREFHISNNKLKFLPHLIMAYFQRSGERYHFQDKFKCEGNNFIMNSRSGGRENFRPFFMNNESMTLKDNILYLINENLMNLDHFIIQVKSFKHVKHSCLFDSVLCPSCSKFIYGDGNSRKFICYYYRFRGDKYPIAVAYPVCMRPGCQEQVERVFPGKHVRKRGLLNRIERTRSFIGEGETKHLRRKLFDTSDSTYHHVDPDGPIEDRLTSWLGKQKCLNYFKHSIRDEYLENHCENLYEEFGVLTEPESDYDEIFDDEKVGEPVIEEVEVDEWEEVCEERLGKVVLRNRWRERKQQEKSEKEDFMKFGFDEDEKGKKKKKKEYYCELCNFECYGPLGYKEHLRGKRHKKKMQVEDLRGRISHIIRDYETREQGKLFEEDGGGILTVGEVEEKVMKVKPFFCADCEVQLRCFVDFENHLEGKRHRKVVEEKKKSFFCQICKMEVIGRVGWEKHLDSDAHKELENLCGVKMKRDPTFHRRGKQRIMKEKRMKEREDYLDGKLDRKEESRVRTISIGEQKRTNRMFHSDKKKKIQQKTFNPSSYDQSINTTPEKKRFEDISYQSNETVTKVSLSRSPNTDFFDSFGGENSRRSEPTSPSRRRKKEEEEELKFEKYDRSKSPLFKKEEPRERFKKEEPREGNYQIFVGRLPRIVRKRDLEEPFRLFGRITRIAIPRMDDESERNKGYAFIDFHDPKSAERAIEMSGKIEVRGSFVRVEGSGKDRKRRGGGRKPSEVPREVNVYVGNISYDVVEQDLIDLFSMSEGYRGLRLVRDPGTGRHKGFGFISLEKEEDVERVIQKYHGFIFQNRPLKVRYGNKKRRFDDGNRRSPVRRDRETIQRRVELVRRDEEVPHEEENDFWDSHHKSTKNLNFRRPLTGEKKVEREEEKDDEFKQLSDLDYVVHQSNEDGRRVLREERKEVRSTERELFPFPDEPKRQKRSPHNEEREMRYRKPEPSWESRSNSRSERSPRYSNREEDIEKFERRNSPNGNYSPKNYDNFLRRSPRDNNRRREDRNPDAFDLYDQKEKNEEENRNQFQRYQRRDNFRRNDSGNRRRRRNYNDRGNRRY